MPAACGKWEVVWRGEQRVVNIKPRPDAAMPFLSRLVAASEWFGEGWVARSEDMRDEALG